MGLSSGTVGKKESETFSEGSDSQLHREKQPTWEAVWGDAEGGWGGCLGVMLREAEEAVWG